MYSNTRSYAHLGAQSSMILPELYASSPFVLSFELFPPKTDAGMDNLLENLRRLLAFHPDFVTCTYGAGGGTRSKTLETLAHVQKLSDVPVASHLTCVCATVDELKAYLATAAEQGIENIVAIRGDAPEGAERFEAVEGGLSYGSDLVSLIRDNGNTFGIAVGGYPEVHPEAEGENVDLQHLKHKVDCGADVVVTQLFYNNDSFFRFRDQCSAVGIDVPIVPGLLPVTSFKQIKRITALCGAALPMDFQNALENCGDDSEAQFEIGTEQATQQASELIEAGVPGIHFYVLNKSRATSSVLNNLELPSR